MTKPSVYAYVNQRTGELYIGSTMNAKQRQHCHAFRGNPANAGKPSTGGHLYDSMRKYGIDQFTFSVLSEHRTIKAARKQEARLIRLHQPALNKIGKK